MDVALCKAFAWQDGKVLSLIHNSAKTKTVMPLGMQTAIPDSWPEASPCLTHGDWADVELPILINISFDDAELMGPKVCVK